LENRERARTGNKKKTTDTNFVEEKQQNFIAVVRKWEMLAATKVKTSDSEKKDEQEHIQHFLHKTRFWKFHVLVVQKKKRQKNVQKRVLQVESCLFAAK